MPQARLCVPCKEKRRRPSGARSETIVSDAVRDCGRHPRRRPMDQALGHRDARVSRAHRVFGPLVRFTYTRNSGVAFGLGAGLPFPYAVFSIVAVAVILYLFLRQRVHCRRAADRARAHPRRRARESRRPARSGEVVDFILIGWRRWYWPVFNVADSAVTIGVVLFGITWMRRSRRRRSRTSRPRRAPRRPPPMSPMLHLSVPAPSRGSGWIASSRGRRRTCRVAACRR